LPIKFIRIGSNSIPLETEIETNYQNTSKLWYENNSRNSIEYTLDGVIDFMNFWTHFSKYKVLKELFVICWAGNHKRIRHTNYLSRVDIELIGK
jgi:hypothetical protein